MDIGSSAGNAKQWRQCLLCQSSTGWRQDSRQGGTARSFRSHLVRLNSGLERQTKGLTERRLPVEQIGTVVASSAMENELCDWSVLNDTTMRTVKPTNVLKYERKQ